MVAKGKKAKAAQTTEADAVEAFHLDKLEQTMDAAVDRLKREMKGVIGRVERLSPCELQKRVVARKRGVWDAGGEGKGRERQREQCHRFVALL